MESIVVVCTGNICRSPVAEGVLRDLLPHELSVSSAGTHAEEGSPAAPEAIEFVARAVGTVLDHTARQLTRAHAESSSLLLTMTVEHRAWIARLAPRTVRRTFTLEEFAVLLEALPADRGGATSMVDLAQSASMLRPRLLAGAPNVDIEDPYRGPAEGYEKSFTEVLDASRRIARAIPQLLPRL